MEQSLSLRNCEKATLTPTPGKVSGVIPDWLSGTLIRNGPGVKNVGKESYNHIFDALAVLHRFHIENGQVTYNSRCLESDAYKRAMAAERIVLTEFGTFGVSDPCDSIYSNFKSEFITEEEKAKGGHLSDNCNVSVGYYGDQLYAMTEKPFLRRINPETLQTIGGRTRLEDYITVNRATAHPHILKDGTVLNMGSSISQEKGSQYCIIRVPPSYGTEETALKDLKVLAEIPSSSLFKQSYYHSFGLTEDKIIFIEQPLSFNFQNQISPVNKQGLTFKDCLEWEPNTKTKFHIVCLKTGKIHPIVYETDDLFAFHHANAYEEDDQLIVDLVGFNDGRFVVNGQTGDFGKIDPGQNKGTLRRYVLPLDGSKIKSNSLASVRLGDSKIIDIRPKFLCQRSIEFPRINYTLNGQKYKFVYGVATDKAIEREVWPETNQLTKVDVDTCSITSWYGGEDIWISEPVFIGNPTIEDPAEDDGVLIANILHKEDPQKTTLVVIDAKNMIEVANAVFKTDGCVTSTFHGQWANTNDKVHLY